MPDPGDQRQRHGMCDVGADNAHHRQLRIEQQQSGDADRAGADRGNRNQHAEDRADEHGCARDRRVVHALHARAQLFDDLLAEDQRGRGQQQRKTQHRIDQAARRFGREIKLPERQQRQDARGNAAGSEPEHRPPMDGARPAVNEAATGLGRRRIQQIGADGCGRVDAEQHDQDRRHQRTAADAGHADQQADAEARMPQRQDRSRASLKV